MLTQKQINRELDRECVLGAEADRADVVEKFFGAGVGASVSAQDLTEYTPEHLSLLDIQTKLFNNVIRNNPGKYGGYISVGDIPAGAPIEVLDTVCVGGKGITGNEDSDDCLAKGGQLVKVQNKTTKIKLELIPEEESATDAVPQKDLYYKKNQRRVPKGTVPSVISNYNAQVKELGAAGWLSGRKAFETKPTVGMTYPIATGSNNELQPTMPTISQSPAEQPQPSRTASLPTDLNAANPSTTTPATEEEHPSILDENNDIVSKCRRDAMLNSQKIVKTTTPETTAVDKTTTTTAPLAITEVIYEYRTAFYVLLVIVLVLILGFVGYKWFTSSNQSQ
jgi:hypothetical protein